MNLVFLKDTFGKVIISMALLSIVSIVVSCFGYVIIGRIMAWSALIVDIIAIIVVGIRWIYERGEGKQGK
jgi:hypothetical protein